MCKMVFIGTVEKLEEIPFYKIQIENIDGEYLTIADKFVNPHIYFAGTSRGCSCDFNIEKGINPHNVSELELEQNVRQEKSILTPIRKLLRNHDNYISSKIESNKRLIHQERSYYDQTLELIKIITANTTDHNTTELYCCWAGEYEQPIDINKIVNLNKINLLDFFEIELKEKILFMRQ